MTHQHAKDCPTHVHGAHGHHQQHAASSMTTAAHATLHCLIGCVIGEVVGLTIGVTAGMSPYVTMVLSTLLAYIFGFALTILPLMKRTKLSFKNAFKAIWVGEAVSIGIMELVMNAVDYHVGGMQVSSLGSSMFWVALGIAIPAGYIAAFPVNFWLISRQLKQCH